MTRDIFMENIHEKAKPRKIPVDFKENKLKKNIMDETRKELSERGGLGALLDRFIPSVLPAEASKHIRREARKERAEASTLYKRIDIYEWAITLVQHPAGPEKTAEVLRGFIEKASKEAQAHIDHAEMLEHKA